MYPRALIRSLERASGLDPITERVTSAARRLIHESGMQSVLAGTPLGHPVHPTLVSLPIGLWASAGALDVVGGTRAQPAARRLVGLGALAALPTAVTGAADWAYTAGAERRVGFVHALANDAALVMYLGSWNARRRGRHTSGVVRAGLGAVALGLGGWLGGHLSLTLGVGVDTTAFDSAPEDWTDVAAENEVRDGELTEVTAGSIPVVLTRVDGSVWALHGRCTHRGGPLAEGELVDGCVECPWHTSLFDVTTGQVKRGPATCDQQVLETRVRGGRVEVRRGDEVRALRVRSIGVGST